MREVHGPPALEEISMWTVRNDGVVKPSTPSDTLKSSWHRKVGAKPSTGLIKTTERSAIGKVGRLKSGRTLVSFSAMLRFVVVHDLANQKKRIGIGHDAFSMKVRLILELSALLLQRNTSMKTWCSNEEVACTKLW